MLKAFAAASLEAMSSALLICALIAASSTSGFTASWDTPAASSMRRRMALVEARIRDKGTTLWKSHETTLADAGERLEPTIISNYVTAVRGFIHGGQI